MLNSHVTALQMSTLCSVPQEVAIMPVQLLFNGRKCFWPAFRYVYFILSYTDSGVRLCCFLKAHKQSFMNPPVGSHLYIVFQRPLRTQSWTYCHQEISRPPMLQWAIFSPPRLLQPAFIQNSQKSMSDPVRTCHCAGDALSAHTHNTTEAFTVYTGVPVIFTIIRSRTFKKKECL